MINAHVARYFALNNLALEAELRSVARKSGLDLGPSHGKRDVESSATTQSYYPQFPSEIRDEAERMARNYVLFYSLENAIRGLIVEVLIEAVGEKWWEDDSVVPAGIRQNAVDNRNRELRAGVTLRSERMIDYTNFGELGQIINANWGFFQAIFSDRTAVQKIITSLNTLRAPIAHCTSLSEDEELRLHLSLRDWFRQQA